MTKKTLVIIAILLSFTSPLCVSAQQYMENVQIFGSEPLAQEQSKGRGLTGCLSGFGPFISALIGYEGFLDYWRDIWLGLRYPMYYSDIANTEEQVNKSRYAVVDAFMRCDVNRMQSVTNAYYKLEAELYFLRHFVNVSGGTVYNYAENGKTQFINEMTKYFVLKKRDKDPQKDAALFSGYFENFAGKYKERAKVYTSYGDDPIFSGLGEKFQKMTKSFKDFGSEVGGLGGDVKDVAVDAYQGAKNAVVDTFKNPNQALRSTILNVFDRFQICTETGSPDDCWTLSRWDPLATEPGEKKTFGEVMVAITQQDTLKTEQLDQGEMLARYEVLYGQVGGEGITAVMEAMDKLLNNLDKQSVEPLEKLEQCADTVQGNVCK